MAKLSINPNQAVLLDRILSELISKVDKDNPNLYCFPDVLLAMDPDMFKELCKLHASVERIL